MTKITRLFLDSGSHWSKLVTPYIRSASCRHLFSALMAFACVMVLSPFQVFAQNVQHTENKPDLGLRSDARVDPSTLGMSFSIPLASYPARLRTILFLPVLVCASGYVQANEQKIFAPVPEPQRARLAKQLKLLVKYERQQRWREQYELLSPVSIAEKTKKAYSERRREAHTQTVLAFTPKYTALMYEGRWEIFGCVKIVKDGKTQEVHGEVAAFWENGEWRFSQILFDKDRCSR